MIDPIQNNNYRQTFTGSIKMTPAMRAVEKHLQKTPKYIEQSLALEFYNFIRQIKGDNTANTLIVTTSKRILDHPAVVHIESGSKIRTKTISKYTVTKVKYGDVVREYCDEVYDTPSFRPNLGSTIKHNLIKFGKELFGEKSLTKITTKNLGEYNRLDKKSSRLLKEIDGICGQLEQLAKTNFEDFATSYIELTKKIAKKQSTVMKYVLNMENIFVESDKELRQLTLDLLK